MTLLSQNTEVVGADDVLPLATGPVDDASPAKLYPNSDQGVNDALAEVLQGGVDIHRCEAARALGRIGSDQATGVLLEALLDEDEDVRSDAAEALEAICDPRAAKQLLENLIGDPCSEVKMAALKALANMKSTDVIPWLKRLLTWHNEEIVWDEDEFFEGGWDSWVDLQIAAIKALADFGAREAIPEIVAAINEEDAQDLTEFAFEAFARMGGPGVDALVEFLDDKEQLRRRRAGVALAAIDHDAARAAVLHALKDPAKAVRLAVAEAVRAENFNDEICAILLADKEPEIRIVAISQLPEADTDQLISWLDDPASEVRCSVLNRLMKIQKVETGPELQEKLEILTKDGSPSVGAIALETLGTRYGQSAGEILQEHLQDLTCPEEIRLGALRGLRSIASDEAVSAIAQILTGDERQLRFEAIAALGEIAALTALPNLAATTLVAALNGEITPLPEVVEPQVVEESASDEQVDEAEVEPNLAEAESEDEEDFPTSTWQSIMGSDGPTEGRMAKLGNTKKNRIRLTETDMEMLALSAQTPRKSRVRLAEVIPAYKDVPQFAARVLGQIAEIEIASALAKHIETGSEQLRVAALDSLVQIGKKMGTLPKDAIDALMRVVANSERDTRLLAIRAIGAANAKGCAGFLIHRLDDGDSFVKTEVIHALSCMGVALDRLDELIDDSERSVRLAAAAALLKEKGALALEQIVGLAFSYEGYLRREAGQMLRRIGAAQANPEIIAVLKDDNRRREWGVAIEVLAEINSRKTLF